MRVVKRRLAKFLLNDIDITALVDNVVCAASKPDKCFVTINYPGSGVRPILELLVPDSALVVQELDGSTHTFNFDARPTLRLPSVISKHVTSSVFECPMQPPAVWRPYVSSSISG